MKLNFNQRYRYHSVNEEVIRNETNILTEIPSNIMYEYD